VAALPFALLVALLPVQAGVPLQRSIWELVVNEVPKGEVILVERGGEYWIPVRALEAAGLLRVDGPREVLFGQPHVSLPSLAPAVAFTLDEREIRLLLTVDPTLLATNRLELQNARPPDIVYSRPSSAFLNYSAQWEQDYGTSYFGELGLSVKGSSITSNVSVDPEGTAKLGFTTLTIDRPARRQRWLVGDIYGRAGRFGTSLFVGGLSVKREYSLDPYYFRTPTPSTGGLVATPSTVEVYVNNRLVRRDRLPPGPYEISRLPVSSGLGDVRVVVRDAFGREQLFSNDYYLTTTVLKRGEQDYQYVAGARRTETQHGPSYGEFAATASHRVGLSDSFTLGFLAEGDRHVIGAGPTVNVKLWRAGELELVVAGSRGDSTTGYATGAAYTFTSRKLNVTALATLLSKTFGTLSLAPTEPRSPFYLNTSVSVPVWNRGSFTLGWAIEGIPPEVEDPDEGARSPGTVPIRYTSSSVTPAARVTRRGSISFSYRLFGGLQWSSSVTRIREGGQTTWEGFGGISVLLGSRTNANVTYQYANGGGDTFTEIQQALPVGTGWGYRIGGDSTFGGSARALVEGQNRIGRAFVRQEASKDGNTKTVAGVSGAVVAMGRAVMLSRVVQSSYALVQVPGAPRVRVYANNQVVGRTNLHGRLLVPDLLAYTGSPIRIADEDVPFDYSLQETERTVAPPFRGGALVRFEATQVHIMTGRLVLDAAGGSVVPEFGDLDVEAGGVTYNSPIGTGGLFYLENVPEGRHPATVTFEGRTCAFELVIPTSDETQMDLGLLHCRMPEDAR